MQKLKEFVIKNKISIIVVALLLVVSILTVSIRLATREEGEKIIVTIAGEQVAEYYLNVDGVYSLNGGTNELTVKDGVAYMSASSCPGHDCEKQGKAKVKKMIDATRGFIRYHFQNNSVFADNLFPQATYQSLYSSDLGIPVNITIQSTDGVLTVKDESGEVITE